jgi:hypothetical protein
VQHETGVAFHLERGSTRRRAVSRRSLGGAANELFVADPTSVEDWGRKKTVHRASVLISLVPAE